jgi:hypothetical protein
MKISSMKISSMRRREIKSKYFQTTRDEFVGKGDKNQLKVYENKLKSAQRDKSL